MGQMAQQGLDNFKALIEEISQKNPLQKKVLSAFVAEQDDVFWQRAERIFANLTQGFGQYYPMLADSYVELCKEMLAEQVKFKKTGCYSATSAADVNSALYSNHHAMAKRTTALGASQFLWPNHYALLNFFILHLEQLRDSKTYLEVGPGHGIHLVFALDTIKNARFVAVDISQSSLDLSRQMALCFHPEREIEFLQGDATSVDFPGRGPFELVVVNEVLEHLDDPAAFLRALRARITQGGRLFITTCANAPTMDHTYLYSGVGDIREQLHECGYAIESEIVLPVGNDPEETWVQRRTEINYGALLKASERSEGD